MYHKIKNQIDDNTCVEYLIGKHGVLLTIFSKTYYNKTKIIVM